MTQQPLSATGRTSAPQSAPTGRSTGGVTFAGVMLAVVGVLGVLQGIAAIAKDDVYAQIGKYAFKFNLTAWGWIHLVIGVLVIAVAWGVFSNATWARITGIAFVSLHLVANFMWLPYQPWWALTMIFLDALIIWSLVGHAGAAV